MSFIKRELLSKGSNPKTAKSDALGQYYTAILYLWPDSHICPFSHTCIRDCLVLGGNPIFAETKRESRINRTTWFKEDRQSFVDQIQKDIAKHKRACDKLGVQPIIRLNGTSDIVWERLHPELFDDNRDCIFYDYTKVVARTTENWKLPSNYDLTLSWSGLNSKACFDYLSRGGRVAIVFGGYGRTQPIPEYYQGFPVVDGDSHDLTFIRPKGVFIGLRAKGPARQSSSKFIVWPKHEERHETMGVYLGQSS